MTVINMQTMRYINLLDKVSHVRTSRCFVHNNTLFFAVNSRLISKAIGPGAENIRKVQAQLGKKVKIIKDSEGIGECKRFISDIVAPVKFKALEIKDGAVVITGGSNQVRASLIGRDKRRMIELKKIIQDVFNLDLRIV